MPVSNPERSGVETAADVTLLFRALADDTRRAVVRSLDETHTPVSRDALATYVAKELFPAGKAGDFIRFRDRALLRLHHAHLPTLAEADVIDVEDGQITLGPAFPAAVTLLDQIR